MQHRKKINVFFSEGDLLPVPGSWKISNRSDLFKVPYGFSCLVVELVLCRDVLYAQLQGLCPALPFVPSCHNSCSEKAQVFAGASKLSVAENHFEAFMLCQLWDAGIGLILQATRGVWCMFAVASHSCKHTLKNLSHDKSVSLLKNITRLKTNEAQSKINSWPI